MSIQPIPEGYQTLTPYIAVKGARAFIDFLKKSFQAEEIETTENKEGRIYNAEIRIGTSMVMVADMAEANPPKSATIYMYVTDPDKLYQQALAAGAKSVSPMTDQPYGNRDGGVEDAWGNQWWIGKRLKRVSPEELVSLMEQRYRK